MPLNPLDDNATALRDAREKAALLVSILESTDDAILSRRLDGSVLSWNRGAERIFGYTAEEVTGLNSTAFISEDVRREEEYIVARLVGGKSVEHLETVRQHKNGRKIDVSITVSPIRDATDAIIATCRIVRDITGRKQAEQEIANNSMRLKLMIDSTLDGLITIDGQAIIQNLNASAERMFGFTREEAIGRNLEILTSDPFRTANDGYSVNDLKTGEVKIIGIGREVSGKRKDGKVFPMDLTVSAFRMGDESGFVGIVRDITVRKLVDDNSALLLASIVASSDDAIISMSLNGSITSWNTGAERMFGFNARQAVGQYISIILPPDRLEEEKIILERINRGEEIQHFETVRTGINGQSIQVSITVSPVRDGAGKLIGASKTIRNVTEQRAVEAEREKVAAELARYTRALERSNLELDAFAYAASHDLKAPLRVIHNASTWIEEDLAGHLSAETQENMDLLRSRVRRMDKLLDDLLEYSRIGRETDDRHTEAISGTVLMENILGLLSPPEGFVVDASSSLAGIQVFRMPLQQILINLISNAIKHHDRKAGRIEVSVEDLGADLRFSVKDDGPGIPPQYHEKIFKMFQTLKPRDQVEGSGMGLAMVRKHVDVAGGELKLESAVGQGSTFSFTWPKDNGSTNKTKHKFTRIGETS